MIKNIIFDFDGVILDSVPVKTEAFKKLFEGYSEKKIDELVKYHQLNGGKSRYIKIRYFFEKILEKDISEEEVLELANKYSKLTREELTKTKYLITDMILFIKENYKEYNIHIASGADEKDLKYICDNLELKQYFLSIKGSPKIKNTIVKDILLDNEYKENETILIGDSINDYEAASINCLKFLGYNNIKLKEIQNSIYIDNRKELSAYIQRCK